MNTFQKFVQVTVLGLWSEVRMKSLGYLWKTTLNKLLSAWLDELNL